ncbi:hypothetical protein QFZ76_009336 [Streptomyces sp. V4I2]|nr:hypothetical protein [Streptomyces sp. V4I2]MDQ1051100.1 hypothetical protein [Streptomyces sp. V4I2]
MSAQICALEQQTGRELFTRLPRGVEPPRSPMNCGPLTGQTTPYSWPTYRNCRAYAPCPPWHPSPPTASSCASPKGCEGVSLDDASHKLRLSR